MKWGLVRIDCCAETFDQFGDPAQLCDSQTEFFPYFDGLSQTDSAVIDHQFDKLISILIELYHAADTELEDIAHCHFFIHNLDDNRDFH